MGRVRITSRIKQWAADTEQKIDRAVLEMATDIHRIAVITAPKDSRALVNSARIVKVGSAHYTVVFGGSAVPYAKRRHYENKKTPASLRYLERAGDTTSRNLKRYLKDL